MNQKINTVIASVLILAIATIVIVYMSLLRVDSWLKNNAVDQCAKISKYKEATIEHPVIEIYENCLKLKGYLQ